MSTPRDSLVLVVKEAQLMGATVIGIKRSSKHPGVVIRTRHGAEFTMRVHPGKVEPYKQKGWLRQAMNRADKQRTSNGTE